MCISESCVCLVPKEARRGCQILVSLSPLEPDSQTVLSHHVCARTQIPVLWKGSHSPLLPFLSSFNSYLTLSFQTFEVSDRLTV